MNVKVLFTQGSPYTEADLKSDIIDYKDKYLSTYTSFGDIVRKIGDVFKIHYFDNGFDCPQDDIHIPVCSDWQDKLYVFEPVSITLIDEVVYFKVMYKGIWKL